jgi:hypothetical protein
MAVPEPIERTEVSVDDERIDQPVPTAGANLLGTAQLNDPACPGARMAIDVAWYTPTDSLQLERAWGILLPEITPVRDESCALALAPAWYAYEPRPDITAYELAQLTPLLADLACSRLYGHDRFPAAAGQIEKFGPAARHLRELGGP